MPFTTTVILILYAIGQLISWGLYYKNKERHDTMYNKQYGITTGVPSTGVTGAGLMASALLILVYTCLTVIIGAFI